MNTRAMLWLAAIVVIVYLFGAFIGRGIIMAGWFGPLGFPSAP